MISFIEAIGLDRVRIVHCESFVQESLLHIAKTTKIPVRLAHIVFGARRDFDRYLDLFARYHCPLTGWHRAEPIFKALRVEPRGEPIDVLRPPTFAREFALDLRALMARQAGQE